MPKQPPQPPRPLLQFSLQSLMVVTVLLSLALGVYRQAGLRALATYGLLLFAVGPWFAHLASECLPLRSEALRRTIAHALMLGLFAIGLWSAGEWRESFDGPVAAWILPAALILWVPQYLAFFVVQMSDSQDPAGK
ncbi:hypothetical protein ETAA8_64300 [Anatilimnocola aggregata]|uniref:Uncharacterized protein n=1 Tax=Anatilimnocola aggregata TaxID=2528021 RepID=A0A517YM30_9BACT|nr:hypothetical protein [Anatilimnocola aggregata]QDU31277.1 hypothetical protein ETAA8_64300 [Anatilimnocola aggregata]